MSKSNHGKPPTVNGRVVSNSDVQRLSASGGKPIPAAIKGALEAKLGTDLSNVRVHTGPNAARMTVTMGAQAFAVGNHIVMSPSLANSQEGRRLLAHEITHMVQQQKGIPKR